jgi:hypothetical protein
LAGEPPAINPFGPRQETREDAVAGYVETSDGKITTGMVYLTRDMRLMIFDPAIQRQREIPLRVVKQIDCTVKWERMEREWRFKELASDEKLYTGRSYPAREYEHTITLQDGRTIRGPLAAIVYVQPDAPKAESSESRTQPEAERFYLRKRDKGKIDTDLKSLLYVRQVRLGEGALEEGKRKKKATPPPASPG